MTEAVYDEMFDLNAKGPLFAVQKLTPLINRGGSIVFTTSIANVKGMPGNAAYGAVYLRMKGIVPPFYRGCGGCAAGKNSASSLSWRGTKEAARATTS